MLRQAVAADLDHIEEGYQEHFLHEREHGAFTVFQEGVYPTIEDAKRALLAGALFVCEEGDILAGSIIADTRQPDEYGEINWPSRAADEKVMVIHLVIVRPGMAGKGIGSSLVNYALEIAKQRSCEAVRLDTGSQNIPAVSLYRKLGFELAGTTSMKVGGLIAHDRHLFFEKRLYYNAKSSAGASAR
ncbi:acetyltransferase [Desulfovibrio fairfieldensis]|uniref:Acetyltransferase n=2 Tax=Desulfovibrio fairfieldensis TaxID=44742 RepID=A0A0X8JJT9_9BACT|nr:acetyltransferase [Desulfovibrio fairfieldensis]